MASAIGADNLAAEWDAFHAAEKKREVRTATNVLARIGQKAAEAKAWPDLAAAVMRRTRLEYGFTEENALDAERQSGFVAKYAAQVERSPAEVRPMLRLALAHDYLSLNEEMSWWRGGRTQLADATNEPPWSAENLVPALSALFDAIAADKDALAVQKVESWGRLIYVRDGLGRACRPTLWDFAVNDAVDFVGRVNDSDQTLRRKVLGWLDALVALHPVDTEPDAHVYARYRKLQLEAGDKLAFAERWFSVSAIAASAAYDAASVLAQGDTGEERIRAYALAERFHAKWPKSAGGRNCRALMKELEQPSFSLKVENQLLARGETISVTAKNITNLCFRLVPVSFGQLIDRDLITLLHGYEDDDAAKRLKSVLARKPAAEWTCSLEDRRDYLEHELERPFPDDVPPGYYVCFAATNDRFGADGLPCRCVAVSRTDLHLVYRSDARGWTGFVNDAETGLPRAGVTVEYWRSQNRKYVLHGETTSAADGSWSLPVTEEHRLGFVRARVGKEASAWDVLRKRQADDAPAHGTMADEETWRHYVPSEDSPVHVHLVTDCAIYRPGQTVKFKGYVFHADAAKRDFRVLANRKVFVDFIDVNDKAVGELALFSNDFGTFSGEFAVPRDRLTGEFTLKARLIPSGGAEGAQERVPVSVEEYKRPKFTADFGKREGLRLGVETKLWGKAVTYTGLPVAEAKVKWTISRETIRPYWWRWWHAGGDGRGETVASGEVTTDATGAFVCAFVPAAPQGATEDGEPRYRFSCRAEVTDPSGEMHAAATSFVVGTVPWKLGLSAPRDTWQTASAGVDWTLRLQTVDEKPIAETAAEVKVYALKQPQRPIRAKLWTDDTRGRWNPKPGPNPADPRAWENGEMVASVSAKTSSKGEAKGNFALKAGVYRIEAVVKTPDGKTARDLEFVRVIDPDAKVYGVCEPVFRCFEKGTVKVGETARLFFGTGYDGAYCRIRVKQGDRVLADEVREGSNWVYGFPVAESHRGVLCFETTFVRENRLYHENRSVFVPWDNLELKVTREHMTNKLLPDARETWRFRIGGADTNEVRRGIEALAFMYDKSLDALKEHYASLPFGGYFTLRSSYSSWNRANAVAAFALCWGKWPDVRGGGGDIAWPSWRAGALGIFERVSGGWRGGGGLRGRGVMPGGVFLCACESASMTVDRCVAEAGAMPAMSEGSNMSAPEGSRDNVPDVVLRKNLNETAFFMPSLVSDERGVVEFTFTVPQALTGWKFFLLAHGRNLANGSLADDEIATVKPLMVEPNGPRFAREGDRFLYPVKVTNTDDKPRRGKVSLAFFDAESGKAETRVCAAADGFAFDLKPGETKTFEFPVAIPDGCGYLRTVAKAAGAEFTDGEEGYLPVLSRRVMVQESLPMQIRKAGTCTFTFEPLKASGASDTLRHVGLAAQVVGDPTWYAFLALPYLMEYPHECCEQVFSRYYANALAAKIANADPAYKATFEQWERAGAKALKSPLELNDDLKQVMLDSTPWVREAADEARAKRHLGELFGSARLDAEQTRAIEKLRQSVASDGLWPWFPGGPGSVWVTMHILTGFERLKALGICEMALGYQLDHARRALDREMERGIAERLSWKTPFRLSSADLRWLYLQSFVGSWNGKYAKLLVEHLEKEWTDFGIAGQSIAAIVLSRRGNAALAKEIVKSLKERAVRSEEKGLYWKREAFFDCSLYGAPVSDQAMAMEAFAAVTPEDVEAYEDARRWLLEQKRTQNWSSTVSTADAVYAILLGRGRTVPAKAGPVTMTLGGVEVPRANVEAGTGFYEARYVAEQVKPAMGDIVLARGEDALGWASVTWTYLEDAAKVKAFEQKDLRLTKTYYKKTDVGGKVRLVALGGGEKLMPGDELVARLAIDSDRILEYVHLKDERPASAEPVDVISGYRWQDGLGYYRSTRDTATHCYFDRLPRGNFVLETSFRVRQQGVFASGLATLECMYAPEFGAHSAATVISVEK